MESYFIGFGGQEGDQLEDFQIGSNGTGTMEDGDDVLVLIQSYINFSAHPDRVHRIGGEHDDEHIACCQFLDDLFPPGLASMQSSQDIVKDGALIIEHATEVLDSPVAALSVRTAPVTALGPLLVTRIV